MGSAETLVAAVEQLELGQAFADPVRAAEGAIAELRAGAEAELFPTGIVPLPSEAYAALTFYAARMPPGLAYGTALADLHGRCVRTWPSLADLIRAVALPDVGAAGAQAAMALQRPEVELAREAVDRFHLTIARQLAGADGHPLQAAGRALEGAEGFRQRLAVVLDKFRADAAAEIERAAEERRAAERAREDEGARGMADAAEAARQAEETAAIARERARRLRCAALAQRLRRFKPAMLTVGGLVYATADVMGNAATNGFSDETLGRFEAALDAASAR
jgi:hypothetical protein